VHPWPRHGVDQIRHLVNWPACASITVEPVRGAWPHAEQDALIDCEMLGPWVTYARFKSPQALTEPRSLSTAWKHISSRRYVAHCTEYASTESSGSRTYRAASPVRATSGPRDASRGATPPRSIRRYPTTSALLGSGRLPPWTKLGSVRASVHGRRSSVLRLRRFASRGDTGRRPVRLRRCLNHGQVTCWRVAGKGTRRATQTPFA
jgi:hypothetical protein